MPNILQVPVPTVSAALCWPARQSNINSLLFINQDLNNYVYIGQEQNITAAGQNTIPIPPNGTFSGDASSAWYVIGNVTGTQPLVVVPNGQNFFTALTQGYGSLAIPSIHSPNFDVADPLASPNPSWAILKNGLAYFVGLILSGGTIIGPDYIINTSGAFFYSGTPALGNLVMSIASTAGMDTFSNPYKAGFTVYGTNNTSVEIVTGSSPVIGFWTGSIFAAGPPEIYGGVENSGLANEYQVLIMFSGEETGSSGNSFVTLYSDQDNAATANGILGITGNSVLGWNASKITANQPIVLTTQPVAVGGDTPSLGANSSGDLQVADGGDGQKYATQRRSLLLQSNSGTITTSYTTVLSSPVSVRSYRISGVAYITTSVASTTPAIQFTGPAASAGEFAVTTTRAAVVNSSFDVAPNTTGTAFASIATSGQTWICQFDGWVTFSGSGTFELQFAATAGSLVISAGSYADLMPV
jgi:hypothetical protein